MKKKMNYYEILKISQNATNSQIKASYKQLAKKYHPDLYRGDREFAEEKMKEINEAYDILSNPETKAEYDEYLQSLTQPAQPYTPPTSPQTTPTSESPESQPNWSFTQFILEKISKLDAKRQLQLFIAILIFILSIFLINLIEVKYYLTKPNTNTTTSSNTTENLTTNTLENDFYDTIYNETNDFQTIDDLFYNIFEQYQQNIINQNQF